MDATPYKRKVIRFGELCDSPGSWSCNCWKRHWLGT